uniref:Uncharacterized protein n=1 Tax=Odontella aurita TaxID=265563 RepID=A0A7S4NCI7_9STRA
MVGATSATLDSESLNPTCTTEGGEDYETVESRTGDSQSEASWTTGKSKEKELNENDSTGSAILHILPPPPSSQPTDAASPPSQESGEDSPSPASPPFQGSGAEFPSPASTGKHKGKKKSKLGLNRVKGFVGGSIKRRKKQPTLQPLAEEKEGVQTEEGKTGDGSAELNAPKSPSFSNSSEKIMAESASDECSVNDGTERPMVAPSTPCLKQEDASVVDAPIKVTRSASRPSQSFDEWSHSLSARSAAMFSFDEGEGPEEKGPEEESGTATSPTTLPTLSSKRVSAPVVFDDAPIGMKKVSTWSYSANRSAPVATRSAAMVSVDEWERDEEQDQEEGRSIASEGSTRNSILEMPPETARALFPPPLAPEAAPVTPESGADDADVQPAVVKEVDYKDGDIDLLLLIMHRHWDDAARLCAAAPEDAASWVCKFDEERALQWRILPIHAAVVHGAPERTISALLAAYPEGAHSGDDRGMTPLHLAMKHGSGVWVVNLLLASHPGAVSMVEDKGRTPLDLVEQGYDGPDRKAVVRALKSRIAGDAGAVFDDENSDAASASTVHAGNSSGGCGWFCAADVALDDARGKETEPKKSPGKGTEVMNRRIPSDMDRSSVAATSTGAVMTPSKGSIYRYYVCGGSDEATRKQVLSYDDDNTLESSPIKYLDEMDNSIRAEEPQPKAELATPKKPTKIGKKLFSAFLRKKNANKLAEDLGNEGVDTVPVLTPVPITPAHKGSEAQSSTPETSLLSRAEESGSDGSDRNSESSGDGSGIFAPLPDTFEVVFRPNARTPSALSKYTTLTSSTLGRDDGSLVDDEEEEWRVSVDAKRRTMGGTTECIQQESIEVELNEQEVDISAMLNTPIQ